MTEWLIRFFWALIRFPEYSRISKHISGMKWFIKPGISSLPLLPHFLTESRSIDDHCDKGTRVYPIPANAWITEHLARPLESFVTYHSFISCTKCHCPLSTNHHLRGISRNYLETIWNLLWKQKWTYGNSYNLGNVGGPSKYDSCVPPLTIKNQKCKSVVQITITLWIPIKV